MNRIVFCLDCPHYQNGGYCSKTRKDVGALTPACDKAPKEKTDDDIIDTTEIIENAPQTTKKCERCGENLPLSMYEWINTKDGRKLRRICSNCYHEAMRKGQNKHKSTPPKGKKTCSSCGKTLPLSDFGMNKSRADGLQPMCKECKRKDQQKYRDEKKKAIAPKVEKDPETKHCPKCDRDLPRSAFHAKLEAKDGLQSWCKECAHPKKTKPSKTETEPMNTQTPTPAPVLNEGIATVHTSRTVSPFDKLRDSDLVDELRARGYDVTATKTVFISL